MSLPKLHLATHIADRLNELSAKVKTRSRASLTDANHLLESIAKRLFNALFDWNLENLNLQQTSYPAVDLGERDRRIAVQVTNENSPAKITHTADKAAEYGVGRSFDRLLVFFLLPEKPSFPKKFVQPSGGPMIEAWDIADLLKQLRDFHQISPLARAAAVLDEEMGKPPTSAPPPQFDVLRITQYAPEKLIGREDELKLLNAAWAGNTATPLTVQGSKFQFRTPPRILTFVALGGEGKSSLVATWAVNEMLAKGWPGCDAAFAWSFYRDGTDEKTSSSSDLFLKEALDFFGNETDKTFAASGAHPWEKGKRLAHVVGQRRSLLILDGLEPLQCAPNSPTPGALKDQGIVALLKSLAGAGAGLCIVTTRYSIPDLKAFWESTAPEVKLLRLSSEAGVSLLSDVGVTGAPKELQMLVEDMKGHALTLTLLGGFLRRAFHGDIRQRDRVKFEKADENIEAGHAFRVMAAYEHWLSKGGNEGRREVAVLRLMGLFDRPADAGCLAAVRREKIAGLTEPLFGLLEEDWEFCITGLESAKLLTVRREASGALVSLDAHPLLREYFARQLRKQQPKAWRAAHSLLYAHLSATTPDKPTPTLEDLQPLYQAVAHGCQADLHQEARDKIYVARILRGNEAYSTKKLGAFDSNLLVVRLFFEQPWSRVSPLIREEEHARVIREATFFLRAVGRLTEAVEPAHIGLRLCVEKGPPNEVAAIAGDLGQLMLTIGGVRAAVEHAQNAVTYADQTYDPHERQKQRAKSGHALCQAGRHVEAVARYEEAESVQPTFDPGCPLLRSGSGFGYCDVLLAAPERAAWRETLALMALPNSNRAAPADPARKKQRAALLRSCKAIYERATQTIGWARAKSNWNLEIPFDNLTLARAALISAILGPPASRMRDTTLPHLTAAVDGLNDAKAQDHIPRGLLTRAWFRSLTGQRTGPESAQADLNEAWEIAERGPMKLHLADIHLYRARLFFREKEYPWNKNPDGTTRGPADDLAAAEKLINDCGYHRRDEELADAKRAILGI